ncbi:MAG: hypothetical protein QMD65_02425 [Patescibacteria group bacterium]|nr:hypothetical protein [Patescibacteria group bacterium]
MASATYYNLTVGSSTATTTYVVYGGDLIIQNQFLVATSTGTNTFNGGSATVTLTGSGTPFLFGTNAAFIAASSTFIFQGTSATTIPAKTYWNLQTNGNATYTLAGATIINNDLTVTAGTLAGTSDLTVNGANFTGNGTVYLTGGVVTFDNNSLAGESLFGGDSTWSFYNLTLTEKQSPREFSATGSGGITVAGTFTISDDAFLWAGSKTWRLTGSGTPFVGANKIAGTGASTFIYEGVAATNVASTLYYYNLTVGGSGTTATYTAAGNIKVGGALLIATSTGTNTFNGGSATITLTGSGKPFVVSSNEVFEPNNSTVNYTAISGSVTLGTNYANLGVGTTADSNAGVTYTLGAATTVSGVLTIGNNASTNSDTLNGGSYVLELSGTATPLNVTTKGILSGGTGTVKYTGSGATTYITATSTTYYNLQVIPGVSTAHYFNPGTITVSGNLDLARDNSGAQVYFTNNPNVTVGGNLTVGYCTYDPSLGCGSNIITVTKGSGTITLSPTGTKTWTDSNSTKQNIGIVSISGGASTPTINLGSAVLAQSISVATGHNLSAGANTITLNSTGAPFTVTGTFTAGSSTVLYAGSGSNTTVGATTYYNLTVGTSTGTTSYIAGGNMTVNNRLLVATSTGTNTFNGGTATINLAGSGAPFLFGANGAFSAATSTVVYSGAATSTVAALTYYNLQTNNAATYNLGGAILVNNDLTLTDGTLAGTANVNVLGGDATGNGVINLTNGTFTIDGSSGNFGGATGWTFNNLTFGNGSGSYGATAIGTGAIAVSDVLTIRSDATFSAGQKTWTLSGTSGAPLSSSGIFTAATSTFAFTGNNGSGNTAIPALTFYNLTVNNASETFAAANGLATNNNLTITTGTFSAPSGGTITISGSYSNSGTFTHSNGTVVFNATATGKTIIPGGSSFYNLTFNGSGGGWSSNAAMVVGNNLTMTAGTLSGTQSITVNGGNATGNGTINLTGGTFALNGSGSFSGTTAWTFSLLTFGSGGTASTTASGAGGVAVSSVLTIGSGSTLNAGSKTWTLSGTGTPFVATGAFSPSTSKIVYAGTTTATNVTGATYYNIDIGASTATTTYTLAGDTTVSGVMTIIASTGTNTLNGSTRTLIFSGTGTPFVINERSIASAFAASSSTVRYTGDGSTTNAAATYYNLEIKPTSGTHTMEAPGTFAVTNNLVIGNGTNSATIDASGPDLTVTDATTIASNATFAAPGSDGSFSLSGNYSNSGTFTAGSGTVTLNGSSPQTLSGIMTDTSAFGIFVVANNSGSDPQTNPSVILSNPITAATSIITTASAKIRFPASQTSTLTDINWQGGPTTSTPVYLRSSLAGTEWGLAVTGGQTVQYVDAKDSNACSGNNINANNATTIDSGNNSCWSFPATVYATSGTLYSHIIDTEIQGGVAPNSFLWRGTKPTNTNVKFQFAFSNSTNGPWNYFGSDCTSDTYYTGATETWIGIQAKCYQNQRYLRYKVVLETMDETSSPTVTEVILNYAR